MFRKVVIGFINDDFNFVVYSNVRRLIVFIGCFLGVILEFYY